MRSCSRVRLYHAHGFPRRGWLGAVAAAMLLLGSLTGASAPAASAPRVLVRTHVRSHVRIHVGSHVTSHVHVIFLRGAANIFSLGMDQMAAQLRRQGIYTTVDNHLAWASLADEAAAEYKSGRVREIIVAGHSLGAMAVTDVVARLGEQGVPVRLAIGLDPIETEVASGRVGRYINYYISDGVGKIVERGPRFHGTLVNVDVKDLAGVGHTNIEKNPIMQRRVISAIRAAVYGGGRAAASAQAKARPSAQGSAQAETK